MGIHYFLKKAVELIPACILSTCLLAAAGYAQNTDGLQAEKPVSGPVSRQRQRQVLGSANDVFDRQSVSAGSRAERSETGNTLKADDRIRLYQQKIQRQQRNIKRAGERAKAQAEKSWQRVQLSAEIARLRFQADQAGIRGLQTP